MITAMPNTYETLTIDPSIPRIIVLDADSKEYYYGVGGINQHNGRALHIFGKDISKAIKIRELETVAYSTRILVDSGRTVCFIVDDINIERYLIEHGSLNSKLSIAGKTHNEEILLKLAKDIEYELGDYFEDSHPYRVSNLRNVISEKLATNINSTDKVLSILTNYDLPIGIILTIIYHENVSSDTLYLIAIKTNDSEIRSSILNSEHLDPLHKDLIEMRLA